MAKLSYAQRKRLPDSSFAIPESRSYPIPDKAHAKNALARSSGKRDQARVRKAVHKKFPSLAEPSGVRAMERS